MSDAEQCPYCSSTDIEVKRASKGGKQNSNEIYVYVECQECKARGPRAEHSFIRDESVSEAIEEATQMWNSVADQL